MEENFLSKVRRWGDVIFCFAMFSLFFIAADIYKVIVLCGRLVCSFRVLSVDRI